MTASKEGLHSLADDKVQITLCPNGPMLVRGPVTIKDAEGNLVRCERSTLALCRCGKTSIAPFCDGTHKLIKRASTLP